MERSTYFVKPNPLLAAVVVFGLWLTCCTCLSPYSVPYQHMWYIGEFYNILTFKADPAWKWTLLIATVIIHAVESIISIRVTAKKGVTDPTARFKWWLSTLILGIFSMRHLLKLEDKKID